MRGLRPIVTGIVVAVASATADAADLRVPEDFDDLKAALSAAEPGDRVLVRGGRWRSGRITRSGVALVGQGAVLSGVWEISGTGASIEGFTFRDAHVTVAADGVALRGNRFIAPKYTVMVESDGVTDFLFERNRCTLAAIYAFNATNAVARDNRLAGGEIALYGATPLIEDNVGTRSAQVSVFDGAGGIVRRNRTTSIYAWGVTSASIQDNTIVGGFIDVEGDDCGVEVNRLTASSSIHVKGDSAVVRANTGTVGRFGVSVLGAAPVVMDNVLARNARIPRLEDPVLFVGGTTPGSVVGNVVTHTGARGIIVNGQRHEVADNVVRGSDCLDSLFVTGSGCAVRGNLVEQTGGRRGKGSGIVADGNDGVLEGNAVTGALHDGIVVTGTGVVLSANEVRASGRCGITILAGSDLTLVAGCTVSGAGWSAVLNVGDRTTFSGGSFVGGVKVDVLDLGGATQFANATFSTKSTDPALAPFR